MDSRTRPPASGTGAPRPEAGAGPEAPLRERKGRTYNGGVRVPGVARVQTITRPQGTPIEHTSIPFLISMQGVGQQQSMKLMKDRIADMKTQDDDIGSTVASMRRTYALMTQMTAITDELVTDMHNTQDTMHDLRDKMADFDDFFRPVRNYFYWEPNCFDIPGCWAFRSVFDTLDGVSALTDQMDGMV